jgi:hypothetical protein
LRRLLATALAADALVVLAFAGFGRRSHDESGGVAGTLGTAAPFLIGLAIAWVVVALYERRRGRGLEALISVDDGVVIALIAVAVGMFARRLLWDRGTALTFVVVTTAFVTLLCAGWRAVWNRFGKRRPNRHANTRSPAS